MTSKASVSPHAHTGLIGAELAAGAMATRARGPALDAHDRQTRQRLRLEHARAAQFEELG